MSLCLCVSALYEYLVFVWHRRTTWTRLICWTPNFPSFDVCKRKKQFREGEQTKKKRLQLAGVRHSGQWHRCRSDYQLPNYCVSMRETERERKKKREELTVTAGRVTQVFGPIWYFFRVITDDLLFVFFLLLSFWQPRLQRSPLIVITWFFVVVDPNNRIGLLVVLWGNAISLGSIDSDHIKRALLIQDLFLWMLHAKVIWSIQI